MKSILITGASRGIGRAVAVAAAKTGNFDKIIITAKQDISGLELTEELIKNASPEAGGTISKDNISIPDVIKSIGDVGDTDHVSSLRKLSGPVDILINNAGISYHGLLMDMTREEWDDIVNTNITSIYNIHISNNYS